LTTEHPAAYGFRGEFLQGESDRAAHAEAVGVLRIVPQAVALPGDADDVASLVGWASATGSSLVPRGAATGIPGGNIGPGVIVDLLTHFQDVVEIDPRNRRCRVQPGVKLGDLNRACATSGLHFPPDPSSGARCSLGGMIANNAAGAHSVRYGATRSWVHSLDVVLDDGSRATVTRGEPVDNPHLSEILGRLDEYLARHGREIRERWPRLRKNSSGYALREYLASGDAVDLLVGSEGTLAIVVEATLDLAPLPSATGLALIEFDDLAAVGHGVNALLPLEPSTCELLDRTFLEIIREAGGEPPHPIRPGLEAILLVEVTGDSTDDVRERLHQVEDTVRHLASGIAIASDPAHVRNLWEIRHAASPIIHQMSHLTSMAFMEDSVVPVEQLSTFIAELRDVLARHHLPAVIFGHAGDANLHVNPLVDVGSPAWRSTIEAVLDEIVDLTVRLGGTLAGEHGDGRLRAPLLSRVWGDEMVAHFRTVKQLFDPAGLLNPGVIIPLPEQQPFEAFRHEG
jgi:FAD/FMN-containing dehydrogenase